MSILLNLFVTFFKIGAFTFGGGYAMLPLIQQEVFANNWIDKATFIDLIAVSESTPGPFAINSATFIGSLVHSPLGALCATLGVILPSFIIILIVAKCYEKFKNSKIVSGCMSGLRPAAIGLIAAALIKLFLDVFAPNGFDIAVLKDISTYAYAVIFILCAVLAFKKVHPILIICIAAVLGIITGYLVPILIPII